MRLILIVVVLMAAVVLAVQNAAAVTVMLFVWHVDASLAVIIFLCFGLGAIACALAFVPNFYRRRSALRKLQQRISQLEADNAELLARLPAK